MTDQKLNLEQILEAFPNIKTKIESLLDAVEMETPLKEHHGICIPISTVRTELERQLVTGKLCLLLRFSALSQPWVRITKR